jgi:endonuclease/exonuclease/phosphatase family metal-dependent hydrolase
MDRFSVATFNLYNFQLPGLKMNPFQKPWTKTEFEKKVSWTGRMLETIDADIVGLEELWNAEAMETVLARRGLEGEYDLLATPATGTKIVCAALVRKGLLQGTPTWVSDFPDALRLEAADEMDPQAPAIAVHLPGWSRPVLHFQVSIRDGAAPVEVFVTHLKSKLPTQVNGETWYQADPEKYRDHRNALGAAISTIRRTAEAAALRVLLTDVMKGTETPVLVLGDLNDGKESNTIDILTEQPNYLVGDSEGGADIGLYTAQTLQEYRDTRDVYYTHVHQALRESLDHVLVSEQFYDHSLRRDWLFEELVIFNDHLNDEDHKDTGTTDHGVVKVTFKFKPFPRRPA